MKWINIENFYFLDYFLSIRVFPPLALGIISYLQNFFLSFFFHVQFCSASTWSPKSPIAKSYPILKIKCYVTETSRILQFLSQSHLKAWFHFWSQGCVCFFCPPWLHISHISMPFTTGGLLPQPLVSISELSSSLPPHREEFTSQAWTTRFYTQQLAALVLHPHLHWPPNISILYLFHKDVYFASFYCF